MSYSLRKRKGRYSFRHHIPVDLVAHYGRTEIEKALGTDSLSEAKTRAATETAKLLAEFDRIRKAHAVPHDPFGITADFEQAWELGHETAENHDFHESRNQAQVFIAEQIQKGVENALAHYGIASPYSAPIPNANPVQAPIEAPKAIAGSASEDHLTSLVLAWAKERKPQQDSIDTMDRIVSVFYEHVGRIPYRRITRAHIIQFKDKMLDAGFTDANTDKHLTNLGTLLNYAANNDKIAANPAKGIKVGARKNAKGARLPFDIAALQAIFSSPVYASGYRPEGTDWQADAAYWFPLLSVYSGARLEEMAQIAPDDVYEETYYDDADQKRTVWVMRLTGAGEDQGVKTEGSERRFPIHAELLARGFVDFVRTRQGHKRVFEMKPDSRGREGANFGKWFGKYLRGKCKVLNERMTFHSFRHTFKDVARARGIAKDVHDAITGHEGKDVSDQVYGGLAYPLGPLVEAMHKYRIPGLDIPK